MPKFIINKGHDDQETVEGADVYMTTSDGKFVDFMTQYNGKQIFRIAASRVVSIHREE